MSAAARLAESPAAPRRLGGRRTALALLCLVLCALFVALGAWQVERRAWKLDLIARVEARLAAAPAAMPGSADWPRIGAGDAYRRVAATGRYLPGRDTLVQAVTERGAGFWLLSPFWTDAGFTVLVNRGFVPPGSRPPVPDGVAAVTGLLRLTEPGGGFLRANDPGAGRWYSRDIAAITRAREVEAAPYFVDADASGNAEGRPVGGLTVVTFRNSHLAYALTWFALAGLSGFGLWRVLAEPGSSEIPPPRR